MIERDFDVRLIANLALRAKLKTMTKKNKEIITDKKPALRQQVTKDFYQNVKAILDRERHLLENP